MAAGSQNLQYGHPTPGPQSPTVQNVMDHLYFCSNSEWKQIREVEQFDYVIIGTGPCGLAFVERVLAQKPMSGILMLERGGYFLHEHFQNLPHTFAETIGGLAETFHGPFQETPQKASTLNFNMAWFLFLEEDLHCGVRGALDQTKKSFLAGQRLSLNLQTITMIKLKTTQCS